jgi:hypothetical protein
MSVSENHGESTGTVSPEEVESVEGGRLEASIHGTVDDHRDQVELTDAEFAGTVSAPEKFNGMNHPPLGKIENSRLKGDISQRNFMRFAEDSIAVGGHISTNELLKDAENSLVAGDVVQNQEGTMGRGSEASVVAAQELKLGETMWDNVRDAFNPEDDTGYLSALRPSKKDEAEIADGLTVFTPEEHEGDTAVYQGDWNELLDYLEDTVPKGHFQPMEIFNVGEVQDVEELDEVLEDLNGKYDEIKDDLEDYREVRDDLNASEISGSNEERYQKLKNLQMLQQFDAISINAVEDPETSEVKLAIGRSPDTLASLDADWEDFISTIEKHDLDDEDLKNGFEILRGFESPESLQELDRKLEEYREKGDELQRVYSLYRSFRNSMDHGFLPHESEEREAELREFMENWDLDQLEETSELLSSHPVEPDIDEEKYENPEEVEEAIMDELKNSWGLSEDSLQKLEESGKKEYILKGIDRKIREERTTTDSLINRVRSAFSSEEEIYEEERFVQEFAGGAPEEYLLEPDFSQRYFTDGEGTVETDEEAREQAYDQGLDLLERIARGQGEITIDDPEIEELEEELDRVIDEISSSRGKPDRQLIERKNEIKSELPEKRREKAFESLGLDYSPDGDYEHLEPHELGQVLDQMAQENLEGDESNPETTAGKAKSLAGPLNQRSDVGNGYVDFDVWDKDLYNLPHEDRQVPCSFPGGGMEQEFINYMRDPGTQIAMLEAGEDEGAVISNLVEYEGDDMLLVHSVESDDGITSRNDISRAIRDHIEDYAEEAGMDGIIYSTGTHNTAAENFLEATVEQDQDYMERTYEVDKKGREDVHLDFDLPEVKGYMERL